MSKGALGLENGLKGSVQEYFKPILHPKIFLNDCKEEVSNILNSIGNFKKNITK